MQQDSVYWGRTRILYTYRFSRRKTLALSVHPDLAVTVIAPEGTSLEAIRDIVKKRGAWIRQAWREYQLYLPHQPARSYVNGETHRYLGRQYRLKTQQGEADSVKCLRGYMWVTTCQEPNPERVQELLEGWYRDHARKVFYERLEICCSRAALVGIATPTLRIQKLAKRWGSCSEGGRILLNLELIKAPKDCIDYVITHELCHLREKHHGPRFWRLLEKLMPDYEDRRKLLNLFADV